MAWDVSADPVDFKEAIAWFRKRVAISRAEFSRLSAVQKRKAFTVAGVAQLDLVNHAWKAIDKAIANGTTLEDFKKDVGADLRRAWSGRVADPPWRLETIFRNNIQRAYAAGRFKQAMEPDVLGDRPVWMYDAIVDGRETDICRECDGTKRPANDSWWQTRTPPCHHACRSSIVALSEDDTKRTGGITKRPPKIAAQDGFGVTPSSSEWVPDLTKYPPELRKSHEEKQKKAPPPAPPAAMKAGVHMRELKTESISREELAAILGSIADAETLSFLERQPLAKLWILDELKVKDSSTNGVYVPKGEMNGTLAVRANREPDTFGAEFKPGKSWAISKGAMTKSQAVQMTLRHELGHHVHMHDGPGSKVDQMVSAAYTKAKAANQFLTRYGKTKATEYFAECYAAYYYRRADLKRHDPVGYAMVEAVLRERGILP